jgi:putative glutathione S-transferase
VSLLINGKIQEDWFDKVSKGGEYVRKDSQFRNWVTPDGKAGISGVAGFAAEKDRYHLYVSYACPWAHRTLIFRKLKKLENMISVSVVHPFMDNLGWDFNATFPAATGDTLYNYDRMHEIYTTAQPDYSGIVTVPVLWDKKLKTIVNNESSEIIRILNSAFNHLIEDEVARNLDFYPQDKQTEIDGINKLVYDNINNGVYRTGFSTTQESYEKAYHRLFAALESVEDILSRQRYLTGNKITEADWRLFVTLIRFDVVYVGHFKCNKKRIMDYPNLFNFMLELYQHEGIAETTFFDHIKYHYYYSHDMINPTRIVPLGPEQDLQQKHNREKM